MAANDLEAFIRRHRSDEANFEKILDKVKQDNGLLSHHPGILKKAEEYKAAKEKGQQPWPEYEKFISEIEKGLLEDK